MHCRRSLADSRSPIEDRGQETGAGCSGTRLTMCSPLAIFEMIADHFREFVAKIHAALPDTEIVVLSIRPSIARLAVWDAVCAANDRLKAIAAQDRKLHFVDLNPLLLGADGQPRRELLGPDNHHLNKDGFDLVSPVVKRAVAESEARYWRGRTRP